MSNASQNSSSTQTTGRLILLALGLSVVMAVELAAGNGFLKSLIAGDLPWQSLTMVLVMVSLSTGAIINAFTATMRPEPMRIASTVASCALAMVAGLEASHGVAKLPLLFYFGVSLVGELAFTYCMTFVMVHSLKLTGKWASYPPYVAAGFVAGFGTTGFIGQSFMSLETVTTILSLVRDLALVVVPIGVLAATGIVRPLRLDQKSRVNSLRLRIPSGAEGLLARRVLFLTWSGMAASLTFNLILRSMGLADDPSLGFASLTVMSLGWFGASFLCLSELSLFAGEQRHGNVTAKLATTSAKRFLKRHLIDQDAWAATVGLKTTNFIIDHDPGSFLSSQLPASIMQIRGEEIQRCVSEVLGQMYLHSYVVGQRIFGAVDPETAVRPCIDTLKMFACLYLDAGPLVERRIKGLTALLPILDPGLAKVLRPKDVSTLIRRNLWFFHFDFGWIDQHVIHTPRSTRYEVKIATLSSKVRHSMMTHLEKTGGVGNFVWIGPEARDRLLQEAPAMKNIIEACPVPAEDGEDELLMFIIKFEQLIPRLQRYFDLDSMRRSLLDFEPSQESARLQNLLGLQINKARTPEEVMEVLGSITSVPWRGFKEKDNALQLILAAYTNLSSLVSPGVFLGETQDPKNKILHEKLLEAVKSIGYPSQTLHNAQISKIALRDIVNLTEAASDQRHPRFQEAWLLMATTDYQRYQSDQRLQILAYLKKLSGTRVAHHRLVQTKAVDALASIGRWSKPEEFAEIVMVTAAIGKWFASAKVDPDICCLLLDAQIFLSTHLNQTIELAPALVDEMDRYFTELSTELGPNHPKIIAVMSRWRDFRTHKAVTPNAA